MTNCKQCYAQVEQGADTASCITCESVLHELCAITDNETAYCDVCYTDKEISPPKLDFKLPESIRRTYIETYRTCPFKFLKEVIEGEQQPPTCWTQVGIDLHDLFEKAILDRSYSMQDMLNEYDHIWNTVYPDMDLFEDDAQKESMYIRSQDSITSFYGIIPDIPMPYMTEEKIRYSIGDDIPDVEFTMDIVFENDQGELELVDWKTGQVMVGVKHSSDLQAPLYIYGVQKHTGRTVKRFTFYYLKDNKSRVFEHVGGLDYECKVGKRVYKINLDEAIKEVKRMFAQIKKGNFNIPQDTKGMFFACKMCHIKKAGKCEGADMQAWNNSWA